MQAIANCNVAIQNFKHHNSNAQMQELQQLVEHVATKPTLGQLFPNVPNRQQQKLVLSVQNTSLTT